MNQLSLGTEELKTILRAVTADLKTHADELRELDAIAGDGDLGVTIGLACKGIADYVDSATETDVGKMLAQCGMNINKVSPSTFGTILASAFIGGGKAVMCKTSLDTGDLVLVGEGAIENIKKRGKAEAGDKTLLDSLIPAVNTLKKEISAGTELHHAIKSIVKAAEEGMKSTANMKAKFGRAQWFQDGNIGIQDGGATAMYYLIKSFLENLVSVTDAGRCVANCVAWESSPSTTM